MNTLNSLPDEILLDGLLPYLDIPSILTLAQTNVHLARVTSDRTLWRRKIRQDYNLPPSVTARVDGWKELYSALRRPSVYVWGATSNGRLGIPHNHPSMREWHAAYDGVNRPVELPLSERVGIVDLKANGYGFVALDTKGGVWAWGTLDGGQFSSRTNPNWLHSGAISSYPREILIGAKIESIDCGRRHVMLLDETGVVWELTAWGKAIKHERPQADSATDPIIQISAGWSLSSTLSAEGVVTLWWPNLNQPLSSALPPPAPNTSVSIPVCVTVQTDHSRDYTLEPLPSEEKIVSIASGSNFIVALTATGRVWTAWVGGSVEDIGTMARGSARRVWEEHPRFSLPPSKDSRSSSDKITHVSAHFETFFAYAPGSPADDFLSSVVYMGKQNQLRDEGADATGAEPVVIEELQGKGVIKVAVGDYHNAALTANGRMLTWGGYSSGALGLGQTPDVSKPQEVHFGSTAEGDPQSAADATAPTKFCFAIAASGWHTGALLVDTTRPPKTDAKREEATLQTRSPSSTHAPYPSFSGRPMPGSFPGVQLHPSTGTPTTIHQHQPGQTDQPAPLPEPSGPLYAIPGMAYGIGAGAMGVLRGNWRGRIGLAGARGGQGRGAGGRPSEDVPLQGDSSGDL